MYMEWNPSELRIPRIFQRLRRAGVQLACFDMPFTSGDKPFDNMTGSATPALCRNPTALLSSLGAFGSYIPRMCAYYELGLDGTALGLATSFHIADSETGFIMLCTGAGLDEKTRKTSACCDCPCT
jgi:hypothetical protein